MNKKINGFTLKLIAVISMIIDHFGAIFFPDCLILRCIGRFAFPIFAFLLVEGFLHTHSKKNYLIRLGAFSLISEIFFDLAFFGKIYEPSHQNVFFTLFLGFVMLMFIEHFESHKLLCPLFVVLIGFIAYTLNTDYSIAGIMVIYFFYSYRNNRFLSAIFVLIILTLLSKLELYCFPGLILILLYNQKEGPKFKYFFYIFYPAHLLIFYIIFTYFYHF